MFEEYVEYKRGVKMTFKTSVNGVDRPDVNTFSYEGIVLAHVENAWFKATEKVGDYY
jgi:hypothetical protein